MFRHDLVTKYVNLFFFFISLGHTLPAANSVLYDAQRQAAAAYANYGPTAEDQLHQLQYHGKHPVQFNHPATVSLVQCMELY